MVHVGFQNPVTYDELHVPAVLDCYSRALAFDHTHILWIIGICLCLYAAILGADMYNRSR